MSDELAVTRRVLSDQVKARLLERILDGRLRPGARIVETRVARELGTSQAPVREALRDLEALGVVESAAFRGARVRHPSAAELLEAFAVRSVLETFAARTAVTRVSDSDLARLEGYLEEMRRAAADGDPYREATADAAFHGLVVRTAGNATLERVWRTLEPFLRTYISIATPGMDRRAVADRHAPVLEALRSRDVERVVAAMRQHFEGAAAALAGRWDDPDAPDGAAPARASAPRASAPRASAPRASAPRAGAVLR